MLKIGSVVDGKYKILEKIGQGGMSFVYLAMNEKSKMTWAIKEVRKDGTKDYELVKQNLIVETDLLIKLKHPNLPRIVDVIDDGDSFLIVMDFIEGNPLSVLVEENGAQSQERVVKWGIQLCDVLSYLHTRKPPIIYRDMKPANIMLQSNDKISVIDFGTAREFKGRNTADTVCLGTVGYAAPEQYGGHETDARTDIYCLGVTLYHLLTGHNPSDPPYEMKPFNEFDINLSSGLEKIIEKCTNKNPNDRYQSCDEVRYDLLHYKDVEIEFVKKQKRNLIIFISVLVLSILSLITGIVGNTLETKEERNNYNALLEEAKRESDTEDKKSLYKQALEIQPDGRDAMLGLISAYHEDNDFTPEESNDFNAVWEECEDDLNKNTADYRDICYEIGKLYWYYYSYGITDENQDNQSTRMKSARPWFEIVLENSDENYENYDLAEVYESIGNFYENIQTAVYEAEDTGMYLSYWEDLSELMSLSEGEEKKINKEIVELEMYKLVVNSIENYAVKFEADDVERDELENALDNIKNKLCVNEKTGEQVSIEAVITADIDDSDKLQTLKKDIAERISFSQKAIETAYGR